MPFVCVGFYLSVLVVHPFLSALVAIELDELSVLILDLWRYFVLPPIPFFFFTCCLVFHTYIIHTCIPTHDGGKVPCPTDQTRIDRSIVEKKKELSKEGENESSIIDIA